MNQDEHDKAKRELGFPFDSGSDTISYCKHHFVNVTALTEERVTTYRCLYCALTRWESVV